MTTATTRSILTGALAASLLLAAPVAAGAAEASAISAQALYEGAQIPSSIADLKRTAAVGANVPVYSEPASSGSSLDRRLPGITAGGGKESRVRISETFMANGEQWVAVQVPESAHGTDVAKSTLSDRGVAYMRAASAREIRGFGDGAEPVESYPRSKSDLTTTTEIPGAQVMYSEPNTSHAVGVTDTRGSTLKSSAVFTYGGKPWVAVEVSESVVRTGIAYIPADSRMLIVQGFSAQPSATTDATTSAVVPGAPTATVPTSEPTASQVAEASAVAKAPAVRVAPEEQSNVFADVLSKLPAVIFAALVMAGTLFILKRPAT